MSPEEVLESFDRVSDNEDYPSVAFVAREGAKVIRQLQNQIKQLETKNCCKDTGEIVELTQEELTRLRSIFDDSNIDGLRQAEWDVLCNTAKGAIHASDIIKEWRRGGISLIEFEGKLIEALETKYFT